jgi:divalent metal cation (Fe/Co/Zn/Cd) transporter
MSHDLTSAHIGLSMSTEASQNATEAAPRHSISSEHSNRDHQPGVSPPLGPGEDQKLDLEGNPSNLAMTSLSMLPAARLSDRIIKDSDATGTSTARAAIDCATSPLHVDTTPIPAAGPMPYFRHSPDGGASILERTQSLGYLTPANEEADPLLLRSKVVEVEQELRRRPSHSRRGDKKVKKYYEKQNLLIENLLKPISKHASDDDEETEKASGMVSFLIYANIVANFILAALQLYGAISSLSLSLFATAADSVFDPFANVLLNWLHRKSTRLDKQKWPAGGSRLENAGNIAYAAVMGSVSVLLIVESARDIGSHKPTDVEVLHVPSLIAVGIALVTKIVLGIFNYAYRKHSSQLEMLWEDCRNDAILNSVGLTTSGLSVKVWFLDPMGAMIISFFLIGAWSHTAYRQFRELCGVAAPPEFLQLALYNAVHIHYQHIQSIESVVAYHSGPKYVVEVSVPADRL